MREFLKSFSADENGATAIEYALIAALVSIAAIAAYRTLGTNVASVMNSVASAMTSTR